MLIDEQREEALKLVEAFKNATQSLKPAEIWRLFTMLC